MHANESTRVVTEDHSITFLSRFALQQSFIINACTMHPKMLGKHKKMLRELVHEWYIRHVARNVLASERLGLGDVFALPRADMSHVSEPEIAYMLASMHMLKREVSPHWWFTASVR